MSELLQPRTELSRVLYAAALAKAGQKDEARKLLVLWPLPGLESDPLLQSVRVSEISGAKAGIEVDTTSGGKLGREKPSESERAKARPLPAGQKGLIS